MLRHFDLCHLSLPICHRRYKIKPPKRFQDYVLDPYFTENPEHVPKPLDLKNPKQNINQTVSTKPNLTQTASQVPSLTSEIVTKLPNPSTELVPKLDVEKSRNPVRKNQIQISNQNPKLILENAKKR